MFCSSRDVPGVREAGWSDAIFQAKAVEFYGDNASLYYNAAFGTMGVLSCLCSPLVGSLSDRYGRKPLMVYSTILYAVPAVLLYVFDLAQNAALFGVFLACNGLVGLGGSLLVLPISYVADCCCHAETRVTVIGRLFAFGMAPAWIASPIFWVWVKDDLGFSWFMLFLVMCSVLQLLSVLVLPESNLRSANSRPPISLSDLNPLRYFRLLRKGSIHDAEISGGHTIAGVFRSLFLVIFCLYTAKLGVLISLGTIAQHEFHFSTMKAALLQSTYGMSQMISQGLIFLLVRVLSKRQSVAFGVFSGLLASSLLSIPHLPGNGNLLFLGEAILSVSFVAYTVSVAIGSDVVHPDIVGEATGVMNTTMAITEGLGPIIFGFLVSAFSKTSYPAGFFLVSAILMLASLVLTCCLPSDDIVMAARAMNDTIPSILASSVADEQGSATKAVCVPTLGGSTILSWCETSGGSVLGTGSTVVAGSIVSRSSCGQSATDTNPAVG